MIDWSFPLTFIVRGDGYPCAGGEWSQLCVSIANMGLWGRTPACVWVIGLAICGDKAMATLATLWEDNIKVCRAHTVLFRRRSDNLFRRRSSVSLEPPPEQSGSNKIDVFFLGHPGGRGHPPGGLQIP